MSAFDRDICYVLRLTRLQGRSHAFEVDDLEKYVSQAREFGCEILSDPTKAPVKLRIPGGPIMEIVPEGRYRKGSERSAAQSD